MNVVTRYGDIINVESRYHNITIGYKHWHILPEVEAWCKDPDNGEFEIYATGIRYKTDQDLSKFLLRWA